MARRMARLIVAALLSFGLAAPLAAQTSERQVRERLDTIGQEIQGLTRRLTLTRQARDDAGRALRQVETALAETHQRLDTLQTERGDLSGEIDVLDTRRIDLEAERDAQLEALNAQLDALYRLGLTPQLKLLLNQDDPARLDRLQTYLNRLAQARNARLDELARLDTDLTDTRRELATRGERLEALAAELAERHVDLASQMQARAGLVDELDGRYASEQSRLEQLNQDRAHAERVLRQIQEELARLQRPPPSTAIERTRGDLPWPVQGALASRYRASDGVHRNGILILAAAGTPVQAVHAGRVVFADWMRGFGNLLIVDHGDQVMTLHAHLQYFGVQVGQAVSRGDVIGAVGSSGGHERPALYFEVRRSGEPIDPQSWIASR